MYRRNFRENVRGCKISNGKNEHVPRKQFIPRDLIYRKGIVLAEEQKDSEKVDVPVYDPLFKLTDVLGEGFPFTIRILDSGKLAALFVDEPKEQVLLKTFSWGDGKIELDSLWNVILDPYGKDKDEDWTCHLPVHIAVSSECTYYAIVKQFRRKDKMKNKFCISLVDLFPPLPGKTRGTEKLHLDQMVLEIDEEVRYYEVGLSSNKNLLAITFHYNVDRYSRTFIVKIDYDKDSQSFTTTLDNTMDIHDNFSGIIFSDSEEKMVFIGGRRFFIVENKSPANYEVFAGYVATVLYDRPTDSEYISLRRSEDLEVLKVTGNRKLRAGEHNTFNLGKVTFEITKTWKQDEHINKEKFGHLVCFYANNALYHLRWFLGFRKFVLVVDPFSFHHLFRLNLEPLEKPISSHYMFEVDWSGKQIALSCWEGSEFVAIKVFHMEPEVNLSLKYQAALVVMENYSLDQLSELNIPRHIRKLVGCRNC